MSAFFAAGGVGMFPTLAFALVAVAAAVLYALRPQPKMIPVLGFTTAALLSSGLLGAAMGVANTFRYVQGLNELEPLLKTALMGVQESLNNLVLALVPALVVLLLGAIGAFRAARAEAAS